MLSCLCTSIGLISLAAAFIYGMSPKTIWVSPNLKDDKLKIQDYK
jgi:hypothetical protein